MTKHDYVDKLVENKTILPTSADFLRCTLDPFHDLPLTPGARPDGTTTASVVKLVRKQLTFSAPPGLAPEATWDALVFNAPVMRGDNTAGQLWHNQGVFDAEGQVLLKPDSTTQINGDHAGIVNVITAHSADTAFPLNPSFSATRSENRSLTTGEAIKGKSRLVGLGFEVTNTTAELYKGGALTVARVPGSQEPIQMREDIAFGTFDQQIRNYSGMPSSEAELFRIPGAQQWKAEDGAYVTATFTEENNKLQTPTNSTVRITMSNEPAASGQNTPFMQVGTTNRRTTTVPLGIDQSYVLLTGLTPQSTFVLTMKAYFEYIPNPASADMDFLRPTPPLDNKALEIASIARAAFPPATPVGNNASGDWFRFVVGLLGAAASAVAPVAAVGMKALAEAVAVKLDNKAKDKQTKLNPPTPAPRKPVPPPRKKK